MAWGFGVSPHFLGGERHQGLWRSAAWGNRLSGPRSWLLGPSAPPCRVTVENLGKSGVGAVSGNPTRSAMVATLTAREERPRWTVAPRACGMLGESCMLSPDFSEDPA